MISKYQSIPGNYYDKYKSKNIAEKYLVTTFCKTIDECVEYTNSNEILDVGCGEGYFSLRYAKKGLQVTALDLEQEALDKLKIAALSERVEIDIMSGDIYNLSKINKRRSLVMCLEVLEHLENPTLALESIKNLKSEYILISVPREPIWRILNMLRGRYFSQFGNTPGHIQHWSKQGIISLVSNHFNVIKVFSPFPWTIVLAKNSA